MNREQIEEIRKRAEAASKGPWRSPEFDVDEGTWFILNGQLGMEEHAVACIEPAWSRRFAEANAEFISHARADVPALLDEIDRLQKRVDEEERDCMTVIRERDEFGGVADKLAAAIGAMTGNDLGEHGSGNDPWRNALDLARGYIAHQAKRCAEMSTTAEGSAEGGTSKGSEVTP